MVILECFIIHKSLYIIQGGWDVSPHGGPIFRGVDVLSASIHLKRAECAENWYPRVSVQLAIGSGWGGVHVSLLSRLSLSDERRCWLDVEGSRARNIPTHQSKHFDAGSMSNRFAHTVRASHPPPVSPCINLLDSSAQNVVEVKEVRVWSVCDTALRFFPNPIHSLKWSYPIT